MNGSFVICIIGLLCLIKFVAQYDNTSSRGLPKSHYGCFQTAVWLNNLLYGELGTY